MMGALAMRVLAFLWDFLPPSAWVPLSAYFNGLSHVRFITKYNDGAWLFRSAGPWTYPNGIFGAAVVDPQSIKLDLQRASSQLALDGSAPMMLPPDARMLDINLLTGDAREEAALVDLEGEVFRSQPNLGTFIHWPLRGINPETLEGACQSANVELADCPTMTRQPADIDAKLRSRLASTFEEWDPDGLHARVQKLDALAREHKNTAVFFHCSCGCDRTGELFAAYAITHLNWTVQRALHHNAEVAKRPMIYEHQVSVQWYCEWLRESGKYPHNDCKVCGDDSVLCSKVFVMDAWAVKLEISVISAFIGLMLIGAYLCMKVTYRRVSKPLQREPDPEGIGEPFLRYKADLSSPKANTAWSSASSTISGGTRTPLSSPEWSC